MLIIKRHAGNPILAPIRAHSFESVGSFNPSVVRMGEDTHLFYRAMGDPDPLRTPDRGFSTIGYARSVHGNEYKERRQIIAPSESWDEYGLEDPRATYFEGKWYVFYTALGGYPFGPENIKCAVAVGNSPDTLDEKHLVTPFNAKAATLFPERINGEAVLLLTAHTDFTEAYPRPTIGIARSKNIEDFWNPSFWNTWHADLSRHALPDVRRTDTEHMEVAATPLLTNEGWLLVYSHIQNYYDEKNRLFGVEALLLAKDNPQQIIGRTAYPFLVPEESYERYGIVANIVFPSGALIDGDVLQVYYGAADTSCAVASLLLPDLLETMQEETRHTFMTRHAENPILSPIAEHSWESRSVSNAAALDLGGSVHLLYRAMGADNTSVMGYARLADGIHIDERLPEPVYGPRAEFEQKNGTPTGNSGCEDPRISHIDGHLQLCYTAYDGVHPTRGAYADISPEDFLAQRFNWTEPILITPADVNNKDICFFPERVDGNILVVHRMDPVVCLDEFDALPPTREMNKCIELMGPRVGMWDSLKIGVAGTPIKVAGGWLFIYHGVGHDHTYRLGAALLDEAGTTVVARTAAPILEPVETWEREGMVNNVVFSCGAIVRGDTLFVYYGGADTCIGVATMPLSRLLQKLQPSLA